jgi:hypothetical protein
MKGNAKLVEMLELPPNRVNSEGGGGPERLGRAAAHPGTLGARTPPGSQEAMAGQPSGSSYLIFGSDPGYKMRYPAQHQGTRFVGD